MHTQEPIIIHQDLKPLNVMVSHPMNYCIHFIFHGTAFSQKA